MKKITIVGAGLSGLTSAIILSKQGFEIEILDKGKGLGGVSLLLEDIGKQTYVFADMTPFDIKSISEYIGRDAYGVDKQYKSISQ
ncbi:NAD(P)-binding protein [candidate division KSB1 bacterium]|nr:NAD(P)-binding protein [candidate division KSB1 bacterium]